MTQITLHLPGDPLPCPRARHAVRGRHARTYMPGEYTAAKEALAAAMVAQLEGTRPAWLLNGARLSLVAAFPRCQSRPRAVLPAVWKAGGRCRRLSKPDADNLWKAYADALTLALTRLGMPWDDALLEIGPTDRYYAAVGEAAGVELLLCPLTAAGELRAALMDNPMGNSGAAS